MIRRVLLVTSVVVLAAGIQPAAQQQPIFRATTSTVSVNVSVKRGNSIVANLKAADFLLTDNGIAQTVEAVSIESVPIDVTLFLDTSGSTAGKLDEMDKDVQGVVQLLRPGDRFRLLTIGDAVQPAVPWVEAGTKVSTRFTAVGGISLIQDALLAGLVHRPEPGRRHLVVGMTDRQDCGSVIPAALLLELAGRTDALLHLVDYSGGGGPSHYRVRSCTPRARPDGVRIIEQAAERTGGELRKQSHWFRASSIARAFRTIFEDFRQSYVLRYSPNGVSGRGWHTIAVQVPKAPNATIRARQGLLRGLTTFAKAAVVRRSFTRRRRRPRLLGWSRVRGRPFFVAGLIFIVIALVANEWVLGASLTVGGRITNPASRIVLALVDVAALLVGLTFLVRRERAPWRQMLLSVVATLFTLGLAEGGLRLVFAVRSWTTPQSRVLAGTIGWRPRANATVERDLPAFGHVRYQTTRDGFRIYGDPASPKRKVLVVGDSFTEGEHLSTGETYYELLGQMRPDLEIFAIGGGGYGTLQEYMLVDESVDGIKPALVIVQMHPNDLINNSHALESRSTTDNNQLTRPYWENGRVVSKFPENPGWGPLYNLARHSYLLRLVNVNLTFLRAKSVGSIEQFARQDDPDVLQAVATTVELLQMIRARAGVPVAVFSARPDTTFSFWSVSEVCRRAGVEFIPGVGEAVEAANAAGEKVTGLPVDAHWNRRGNEIAAGVIGDWIKKK